MKSTERTAQAAWPLLRAAAEPLVVNVGSTTEHPKFAQAFHTAYALSKVALRAFSVGLRQELAVLHPGSRVVHLKARAGFPRLSQIDSMFAFVSEP